MPYMEEVLCFWFRSDRVHSTLRIQAVLVTVMLSRFLGKKTNKLDQSCPKIMLEYDHLSQY